MQSRFSTVIFDVDGTLLHSLPDLVVIVNTAMAALGLPSHSPASVDAALAAGPQVFLSRLVPADFPEERMPQLAAAMDAAKAVAENVLTTPYPGMAALLADLTAAGVAVGVMTNRPQAMADYLVGDHFPGVFAEVRGIDPQNGWPRKPDPTSLIRTMELLGADPATTLYVGDTGADAQAARAAGCRSAHAGWGYGAQEGMPDNPDFRCASVTDLRNLILV